MTTKRDEKRKVLLAIEVDEIALLVVPGMEKPDMILCRARGQSARETGRGKEKD